MWINKKVSHHKPNLTFAAMLMHLWRQISKIISESPSCFSGLSCDFSQLEGNIVVPAVFSYFLVFYTLAV